MHVMFLHGMACTGAVWDGWSDVFRAAGFETHQPSLPHHAPSNAAKVAALSEADYCEWLAARIRDLPETPVLVGHSNGGLLALKLTEMGLSRATLLLNAAGPRGTWIVYRRMLPHALLHFLQWGFWRKPLTLSRWQANHLAFNRLDRREADAAFAALVPESGMIAAELVLSPLIRTLSLAVDPQRLGVPIRSIVALDDNLVSPAIGRAIKRRFGDRIEHLEYEGRGHWQPWETGWRDLAESSAKWLGTNAV